MRSFILVLSFSWLMTCPPFFGLAAPTTRSLGKRAVINCQPIHAGQRLLFRDCVGAYNRIMAQSTRNFQRILSFGNGPNVNVPLNGTPLIWESGTCAIELAAHGPNPQLSSWQNIGIEALRVAHRCANRHQQGYTFIGE